MIVASIWPTAEESSINYWAGLTVAVIWMATSVVGVRLSPILVLTGSYLISVNPGETPTRITLFVLGSNGAPV